MEEHRVGLGTKLFECPICGKKFHYRIDLNRHVAASKSGSKEGCDSTLCSECGASFDNMCELTVHRRKHDTKKRVGQHLIPQKCKYCDLICENQNKRSRHMWDVHDHMAEFCDKCGYKAFGNRDLVRHLECHNENSCLKCKQCGKGFKNQRNLERHIQVVHTIDSSKKFQCKQCGKGFIDNQRLEGHMNMHLGLKPHKCECGAAYQNRSNLLAHKKKSCKNNTNPL